MEFKSFDDYMNWCQHKNIDCVSWRQFCEEVSDYSTIKRIFINDIKFHEYLNNTEDLKSFKIISKKYLQSTPVGAILYSSDQELDID